MTHNVLLHLQGACVSWLHCSVSKGAEQGLENFDSIDSWDMLDPKWLEELRYVVASLTRKGQIGSKWVDLPSFLPGFLSFFLSFFISVLEDFDCLLLESQEVVGLSSMILISISYGTV